MRTEAQKRAQKKYREAKDNANRWLLTLELRRTTDADIIGKLDEQPTKAGYIKRLIRDDISKEEQNNPL